MNKVMKLYHDAAKERDSLAQYKYGICFEAWMVTDEDVLDCTYFI